MPNKPESLEPGTADTGPIRTRQSRSEKTLQAILAACDQLIAEKSFEQISMQEIARTAGVSVGNLYNRFKDKDSLVDYVLISHQQQVIGQLSALLEDESTDLDLLDKLQLMTRHIAAAIAPLRPIFATLAARQARGVQADPAAYGNSHAMIDLLTAWVISDEPGIDRESCRFAVASIAFNLQFNLMFGTPERLFDHSLPDLLARQAYTFVHHSQSQA